jgi:predicted RNA-binding protein YlxR (DUF448 family)
VEGVGCMPPRLSMRSMSRIRRQPLRPKHVPQRTCIACRQAGTKRGLIRLVRIDQGQVEVDLAERRAGRGAYLCPALDCWEMGLKKDRLEYALRTRISPQNRRQLAEFGQSLPRRVSDAAERLSSTSGS